MPLFPAPAKINLFLHVTGRRADGYHTLQTLFQLLDYGDDIEIDVTDDGRIERGGDVVDIPPATELTLRAARLLQSHTGTPRGARIRLHKRIPIGGGLGGGSSDAATTLLALNRLWDLHVPRRELAVLGLQLGADVPVFVHGRTAWAEGVGEVLTPVSLPEAWYVVLVPPVAVSTATVFGGLQLTPYSPAITIRDFQTGRTRNDLEPTVRARHREVDAALHWLAGFGAARMSGSGACVFVPVASAEAGRRILAQAPIAGFVARSLNQHPIDEPRQRTDSLSPFGRG